MIRCRGLVVFVALFACACGETSNTLPNRDAGEMPSDMAPNTDGRVQTDAIGLLDQGPDMDSGIESDASANRDGAVETDARASDAQPADAFIPVDMTQIPDSANPSDAGGIDAALDDRGVDDASVVSDSAVDIGVIFDAAGPDGDAALLDSGAEDAGAVEDMAMVDVAVDAQPPLVDAAPVDAAPVNDAQVFPICPEQPCELGRVCIDGQCLLPEPECQSPDECPDGGACIRGICQQASCLDRLLNQDETDVDCGGECEPCQVGEVCQIAQDCVPRVCEDGRCVAPDCADGVANGDEADVDCGGECALCEAGAHCRLASDCASAVCVDGHCRESSCEDAVLNGLETGVDCGGACPQPCGDGGGCEDGDDCLNGNCIEAVCQPAACGDNLLNGDETDVDCGGPACVACADTLACVVSADCLSGVCSDGRCSSPRCDDAVQNGDEVDIDCGGPCPGCAEGQSCQRSRDCESGVCLEGVCQGPRCDDGVLNGDESDEDCGGACSACADDARCRIAVDCVSRVCADGVCQVPTCDDGIQNGVETDTDCGADCQPCAAGDACVGNRDCESTVCRAQICQVAACDDGVLNGSETDTDCGGDCDGCADGLRCGVGADCESLVCSDGQCAEPRCDDLVANGQETDVDCGGDCLPCADGLGCGAASDCVSGVCTDALCQAPACDDGIQNGDEIGVDCGSECASCSCVGDAVTELVDVGEFQVNTVDGLSFEAAGCAQTGEAAEAVFRFTPPNDGVYCADTAGTEFDSVVYIRTDCSDPSSEVACNDSPDYPRVTDGRVHFAATAGEPIFIFVDAYSGLLTNLPSSGDAVLALTAGRCDGEPICVRDADCEAGFSCDRGICVESPIACEGFGDCPFDKRCEDGLCVQIGAFACNRDDFCGENQRCVNAMCMDPPPTGSCLPDEIIDLDETGRHDGSTVGAFATNNGTCAPSELSPEVVHRFRALEPGMHCVRTIGSGFNTVAYARFNCQQPFSETGCNDDSPLGGATSQFSFFAAVDQDTFIVVDGRDGELASQGDYRLTVSTGPCPECEVSAQCGPGQVCRGDTCTFAPESDSILFTEVGFGDVGDRYIELHNQRNFDVNIGGCEVRVDGVSIAVDDFTIPSEGYVLIGEGRAISTGLVFEQNPIVELRCNDVTVHQVDLNDPGFVQLDAGSLFLSADLETPDLSRQGGAWCRAEMGTPGLANPVCDRCAVTPCEGDDTRACRDNVQVVSRTECELVEGQIQNRCNEVVEETACPASCVDGRCVRAPSLGDVIVTELMVDPLGTIDAKGEWIEIQNVSDAALSMANCTVSDGRFPASLGEGVLSPNDRLVVARTLDPQTNGGVNAQSTFAFALSNGGDAITLSCGDITVDVLDYAGFPVVPGYSLSLTRDALTEAANDAAENWCAGSVAYGVGTDFGSPGEANSDCDPCQPNPCQTPPEARCDGQTAIRYLEAGVCLNDGGDIQCDYNEQEIICGANEACIDGRCELLDQPCGLEPCALGSVCDRAAQACVMAPAPGQCEAPIVLEWSPVGADVLSIDGSTAGAQSLIDDATCGEGGPGPESVYRLSVDVDATFCVSTDGGDDRFDPMLHIRTACADPLTELEEPDAFGCNDDIGDWDGDGVCELGADGCRTAAEIQVRGRAGQDYYIIVDQRLAGVETNYTLNLLPGPCPSAPAPVECILDANCPEGEVCRDGACALPPAPNAACELERIIQLAGFGRFTGDTTGRPYGLVATCSETDQAPEVVHQIQFDENTPVCVTTQGSAFDTVLSVRRALCVGGEIACNDDIAEQEIVQSKLQFDAVAGTPYFIVVDGWNLSAPKSGEYVLSINQGRCADALGFCAENNTCPGTCREPIVVASEGEWEVDTTDAATSIDQTSCTNAVGPEAVFQLQMDYRGTLCLSTVGTDASYDTAISVRNGCADPNSEVACNDDVNDARLSAQVEYFVERETEPFVLVDSLNAGGNLLFSVREGACPNCFDDIDCPEGWRCESERCVECRNDNDCENGLVCSDERCVFPPCDGDQDCGAGTICIENLCVPGDRGACDPDALVFLDGVGVTEGSTEGSFTTLTAGCAPTAASPEVVHELVVDVDQTLCASTAGSAIDTVVYARTECLSERSQVVCDDDGALGGGQTSQFTFRALANVPYYLVVDGKDGPGDLATAGAYRLEIQPGPCPECAADGDCAQGRFCVNAQCVECRDDNDCDGNSTCDADRCVEPAVVCDAENPCPDSDFFFGTVGQLCDLALGEPDAGICVEQGMCRQPIPIQLGDVVEGDNFGRERIYGANCGDGGAGAEVIYSFEAPADGEACFSVVSADYDVVIYLKDICATNPAVFSSGFLTCEDTAGNEPPGAINDRFDYQLTAGETYYFVVDSNEPDNEGAFTFFTHYGLCGAVPAPQCDVDADCQLGQVCTEQRQCVARIGTCDEPTEITDFGAYVLSTSTARNQLDSRICGACANPGGGRCGEAVYRYRPEANQLICVSTLDSNYDTVLYAYSGVCGADNAELACSDDVPDGRSHSQLQLNVQAGTDYFFVADAWSNSSRLVLTVSEGACP